MENLEEKRTSFDEMSSMKKKIIAELDAAMSRVDVTTDNVVADVTMRTFGDGEYGVNATMTYYVGDNSHSANVYLYSFLNYKTNLDRLDYFLSQLNNLTEYVSKIIFNL